IANCGSDEASLPRKQASKMRGHAGAAAPRARATQTCGNSKVTTCLKPKPGGSDGREANGPEGRAYTGPTSNIALDQCPTRPPSALRSKCSGPDSLDAPWATFKSWRCSMNTLRHHERTP